MHIAFILVCILECMRSVDINEFDGVIDRICFSLSVITLQKCLLETGNVED